MHWMIKARKRVKQMQAKEIPCGPYRVFYADPPWFYGKTSSIRGGAADHYSTMKLEQICAMGEQIQQASEKDAVLFLWVPEPILPDAFQVIPAWGFTYKANAVWNKNTHIMGRYFSSIRHEHLLLATQGSCFPVKGSSPYSTVVNIKPFGYHSMKPEGFRTIIDKMYPTGKRIELFARLPRERTFHETLPWVHWGNET